MSKEFKSIVLDFSLHSVTNEKSFNSIPNRDMVSQYKLC